MPRRVLKGIVVSDKNDKTIIVRVERQVLHPIYKKYMKRHKRYAVHDPSNQFEIGDRVRIIESRPISRTKHWIVESQAQILDDEHEANSDTLNLQETASTAAESVSTEEGQAI
jgi:small subunit ribosomal protein S17